MASNDQILAVLADLQKEISDLKVSVAGVPEIKTRTDELIRAVKGHNGTPGLVASAQIQDDHFKNHLGNCVTFRALYDKRQSRADEKIEDFSERMDSGFAELKAIIAAKEEKTLDEKKALQKEERDEQREVRKDKRKFKLELALSVVLLVINLIVTLIGFG